MTAKRAYRLSEAAIRRAAFTHWKLFRAPGTAIISIPNEGADRRNRFVVLDHIAQGMFPGAPDWGCLGPEAGKIRFLEFKADDGKLSDEQKSCHALLRSLGFEVEVTWGRDEPIIVLERWGMCRPQPSAIHSVPAVG